MRAITLRHIPDAIARAVQARAVKTGTSLNKAVLGLLEEGLGLARTRRPKAHRDLDHLAGRWSRAEAQSFDARLAASRRVDQDLWK